MDWARFGPLRRPRTRRLVLATAILVAVLPGLSGAEWSSLAPTAGSNSLGVTGTLPSWNPNVECMADLVTIANVLGTAYPAQSLVGSPYQRDAVAGGVLHPRDLSPECSMTNVHGEERSTFVEIHNVYLASYGEQTYDCSTTYKNVNGGGPYPNNATFCDHRGWIYTRGTTLGSLEIEIDQDWQAKGYCGSGVGYCDSDALAQQVSNGSISLDVQGFVYWDGESWELHPFTSWGLSAVQPPLPPPPPPPPSPPDFWMEADRDSMTIGVGDSDSAAIGFWSLHGFSGTVSLSVSIEAVDVLLPPLVPDITYPGAWVDPSSVTLTEGGSAWSTLHVSASLLTTPGTYSVTVTATSGSITHSVTISLQVVLL